MLDAVRVTRGGILHIDGHTIYATSGRRILVSKDKGKQFRPLVALPVVPWQRAVGMFRLGRRLTRQGIHRLTRFGDKLIVIAFGHIYVLDATTGTLIGEPSPQVGSRPLALCTSPDGVFYGEYRGNAERSPVHVFGSHDGEHWEAVYRFEAVRHVHGVYYDPYTGWIWLTTGDTDAESALWATDDRFASVRQMMGGSQQLRAISLLFTQEHVYFGSDTPEELNYLYRMSRATCQVERLCAVEGSVFHAAQLSKRLYFSTAVEPSTVNGSPWAVLYESLDGQTWQVIARHRKDQWPYKYFQYGQIFLPSGNNETGKLWYSTFSVEPDNWIFSRGICG